MPSKPLISFDEIAQESPFFLDTEDHLNWKTVFENDNPLNLEVGFGNGKFLIEMAAREPESNFIGMDFYHKGIRKAITRINKLQMQNIRIVYGDAKEKIPYFFKDEDLSKIYINFPDPWPKKRHYKRRLIKPPFIDMITEKLMPGGEIHVATDSEPYALEILDFLEGHSPLKNQIGPGVFRGSRGDLPRSKYENNFINAGEKIFYLDFAKRI
ncbi:MAG: tRNA (guanine-N(7)-)-methyltransferase [Nitrospinaceae bacterium]|nr:MAG: tRNA (guanine-N(7)-)-methyltransferase [Nitrospinaceae bacterium]